jgi:hypothetical protein
MTIRVAVGALLLALMMNSTGQAQQNSTVYAQPAAIDVSRLPIDLVRIQRELRQSSEREERQGLNIRYVIDVYGQAPPIVLIDPTFDFVHGPVPNSAPTHREMIEHVTPIEYRAPPADLSALLRWLADRSKK